MEKDYRIIISGGGTGGHIFPALSIADAIREIQPNAQILFVGADNRMEMQRVPEAGYKIVGLPIAGFNRKNLLKNIKVLWLILKSQADTPAAPPSRWPQKWIFPPSYKSKIPTRE